MVPKVWNKLIKDKHRALSATLFDFQRYALSGEPYPGIRQENGAVVEGVLVFNLSRYEISILDQYEGVLYQREAVCVGVYDRSNNLVENYSAEVYVIKPRYLHRLSRKKWQPSCYLPPP